VSPALRRWAAVPALRAMAVQLACLPASFFLLKLLLGAGLDIGWPGAALVQGMLAATVARIIRMAPWWLLIEWAFPLALVKGAGLQLPSWLFLVLFVVFLLVYWSTFRTQVPYYPSGQRAWDAVAGLLPGKPVHLIDIGSGLGGLVLDLAARRPDSRFTGIELAPLPWLASRLRSIAKPNVQFIRGDYESLDFASFDVVFAYLSPAAMAALWRKASAEMRPGTLLLSYEFVISTKSPDLTIKPAGEGPHLYGWHF
jgi:Methyltransferase domain